MFIGVKNYYQLCKAIETQPSASNLEHFCTKQQITHTEVSALFSMIRLILIVLLAFGYLQAARESKQSDRTSDKPSAKT